jgi:hypothetical protein
VAVASLQRRGLIVQNIDPVKAGGALNISVGGFFQGVSNKEVVMLSRQIATLFEAQVSALRAFRLLATETSNPALQERLTTIANDIQSGMPMSRALAKHASVFSPFYVQMVRTGEETGKLDEVFNFLADYLDRNFEVASKAKDHQFRKLDPELEEIMNTNELLPLIPVETSPVPPPLLIASHSHLPNQMTLEIPMDKELKNWVLLCHHIWKNLGRPSLRVFLPGPALFENFVEEWPDSQTATDISLVSEIAPGHN